MRHRGTLEWLAQLRETGRWDRPRFWKRPEYLDQSPWSPVELARAFAALRYIYPPKVTKRHFAEHAGSPRGGMVPPSVPWVTSLLLDPFRPDLSGLLALGFDAAHADVESGRFGSLVDHLRHADQYAGARLELELIAALARQGAEFHYEPYASESKRRGKRGERHPNPDLRLHLGTWITADIKHLEQSDRARRRLERFMALTTGPSHLEHIPATVECLPAYATLEFDDESACDAIVRELHEEAVRVAAQMNATGESERTIRDMLRLKLSGDGTSSHYLAAVPREDPGDARRVRERLDDAASQIPATDNGLIFFDPGPDISGRLLGATLDEWIGHTPKHILGVVLIVDKFVPPAPQALRRPIVKWRSGRTPRKLRQLHHWRRLDSALNWRWLRASAYWF